ncbi:peptidyl-prolyl cis-trans isomerase [Bacillus kexueae]|uniref:peptidyl-prolyl cis-trans isomerase n=1 Tax=Aeribacillus kexueae TaxID=2078952 RepID=UPI001FAEA8BB|nr:peptidyl-prolyl cis-trans isomerase [Bacillus kexueae]
MNGKTLWGIIFGLVVLNCLTLAYFLSGKQSSQITSVSNHTEGEVVAEIGETTISRQDWLAELEKRFGKTTLENMINIKVVEELASKYGIEVPEETIERELKMFKATYNAFGEEGFEQDDQLKDQIRYSILLEELLTKDVEVPEEEMKQFYEENKGFYEIRKSYLLSHIVVNSEGDAKQIIEELKGGSSFEALAAEKSIDNLTASNGGELGYVEVESSFVPPQYLEEAEKLSVGEWSNVIQVDDEFVVVYVEDILEGVTFTYDEVKNQIRRQIALDQMEGNISAHKLWEEIGVSWFYGE